MFVEIDLRVLSINNKDLQNGITLYKLGSAMALAIKLQNKSLLQVT